MSAIRLSIVATMYRSAPFIEEFCERIARAAGQITSEFEIVLVNDGSPDNSAQVARDVAKRFPHIVLVDLSRNFGHHAAILAGLEQARGDWIYLTDIDLEEQPEWLPQFWEKAQLGHDVVYGVQKERIGSRLGNLYGSIFWRLLNAGSSVSIPVNQMTCRLFSAQYRDSLLSVGDKVLYLGALFPWTGYNQLPLELVKTPRRAGTKSTYSTIRKIRQAVDSLTSFTASPLVALFMAGLAIWVGSILFGGWLVLNKILSPESIVTGFTALMFSIWFLGGLLTLGLGILGLYISKLFQEVKDRPRYIIKSVERGQNDRSA